MCDRDRIFGQIYLNELTSVIEKIYMAIDTHIPIKPLEIYLRYRLKIKVYY